MKENYSFSVFFFPIFHSELTIFKDNLLGGWIFVWTHIDADWENYTVGLASRNTGTHGEDIKDVIEIVVVDIMNVDVQLICQCWIQAGFMNIFIKYGCYTFFVKDSRSTEVNNVASSPAGPNLCFSNLTSFFRNYK